jgi:hypothetical protein
MKRLAVVVFLAASVFCGRAQISQGTTNVIRTPELLYITTSSNVTAISNAVKMASSLRIDMTKPDVDHYLIERGMPTNIVETQVDGLSLDGDRTIGYFYPLPGNRSFLVLDMECTERPASGLRGWKNPVLKKAYIQSQGVDIISIALTNGVR